LHLKGLHCCAIAALWLAVPVAGEPAGPLTMGERIDCEQRVQEVYSRHRLWPKDNPRPKPALSEVLPESLLRERVEDRLRESAALAQIWRRPLTGDHLQAEMDRMARNSKDPSLLRELFEALDNDPHQIAECLARPALADRLARSWYASDERFHGALRARVRKAVDGAVSVDELRTIVGEYAEWEEERAPADAGPRGGAADGAAGLRRVSPEQWDKQLGRLGRLFNGQPATAALGSFPIGPEALVSLGPGSGPPRGGLRSVAGASADIPLGKVSPLEETEDAFSVEAVLSRSANRIKLARVSWRKRGFNEWWRETRASIAMEENDPAPSRGYRFPAVASGSCADDTWRPTATRPVFGYVPNLLWTGTETIVWGGSDSRVPFIYNPATDAWRTGSSIGAPPSYASIAVWSGTELLSWGGCSTVACGSLPNAGGRYNPLTDTWVPMTTTGAPAGRIDYTAIWSGTELIVWGGNTNTSSLFLTNSGGRYNPGTNTWTATPTAGAPASRNTHTAVWTGTEMVVWGGVAIISGGAVPTSDGGRYNPATNGWTPTSSVGSPSARRLATAIWSGSEMIVWGGAGVSNSLPGIGGRYVPGTDTWLPTTATNSPEGRWGHTAVWTGAEMVVWGGAGAAAVLASGSRYDPSGDRWLDTSLTNAPVGRAQHGAVWTGTEMVVFGGAVNGSTQDETGGRYNPASNTWVPVRTVHAPGARQGHTSVWTGSEMIAWGGYLSTTLLASGERYNPALDLWSSASTNNVPAAREGHGALWTGTEMIVWGGASLANSQENTGGRYNPASDTWTPVSTLVAAPGRHGPILVWTGTEMLVWGAGNAVAGKYSPSLDTWTVVSPIGAPDPNYSVAVWTGTEMLTFGGFPAASSAGRYNPGSNTWLPIATTAIPAPRADHTAIWTGTEMIVWGGRNPLGTALNDGGRYRPSTDSWTSLSSVSAPSARGGHTAVWTDREMIVWGGDSGSLGTSTGGRYDPSHDTWRPVSTVAPPTGSSLHTSVWTGSQMLVWGGVNGSGSGLATGFTTNTGGLYCAPPPGVADLAVGKTGPASAAAGGDVVYTITVTNNGPDTATAVQVMDPTPAGGLAFASNSGDCTTPYPCSLGTLTSGQTRSIQTTFAIPPAYAGPNPFTNTATVTTTGNTTDPTPSNNSSSVSTTVTAASADLSLTQTGPASALLSSDLVYSLTVTNNGPSSAASVAVTDPTPTGLTFVSNSGNCATAFPCSLGVVAPGTSRTIMSTFHLPSGFPDVSVTNQSQVASSTADPILGNNSAQVTTTLIGHEPHTFYTLTPCRVLDTRNPAGPLGGPALGAGATRTFTIGGACGVPVGARAIAFNVTVTAPTGNGNVRVYPGGTTQPLVSTINYGAGQTRANNGIVPLGVAGEIAVLCSQASGSADFILDVTGYFE